MRTIWRSTQHASGPIVRRHYSGGHRFEPSDFVILRAGQSKQTPAIFLGPLVPGKSFETHKGRIRHDDIISKNARDVIEVRPQKSSSYTTYRLHKVTLEDYVVLSRRLVTPIYPHDASLIVSLFDLHPEVYDSAQADEDASRLEILEAGTGHGSLTLHLSRAIHAGNSPAPKRASHVNEEDYDEALKAWKSSRRAIIHTIDNSAKHSKHASMTVRNYRRGQYHGNVDFHVGDASQWIQKALEERSGAAFLTHAFLDLPNVQQHIALAAQALKTDGVLVVFCPSITQINECALKARREDIPLDLDRVVELGVNGGTGGRLWDLRLVKPRSVLAKAEDEAPDGKDTVPVEQALEDGESHDAEPRSVPEADAKASDADWNLICRPKVGERVTGGGFLAVFKKKTIDDKSSIETIL